MKKSVAVLFCIAIAVLTVAFTANAQSTRESASHIQGIEYRLEEAGLPLTEEQKSALSSIESGPEFRQRLMEILTPEQIEALQASRPQSELGPFAGIIIRLERAGYPLTDTQKEQLALLEKGPGLFQNLREILTPEQIEALRPPVPERNVFDNISRVLMAAGCPLTYLQKEQLASLEKGPDLFNRVMEILTPEQQEALLAWRQRAGIRPPENLVRILEEAGCPLTESQLEAISQIPRGPGMRESLMDILTEEQKLALQNQRKNPFGRIEIILADAGYPLTAEQKEQLNTFEPGIDRRAFLSAILTPEQIEALKNNDGGSTPPELPDIETSVLEERNFPAVLNQNYPNPFNPTTMIEFTISEPGMVVLAIYNQEGKKVRTLVDEYCSPGVYSIQWDATGLSSGTYFARIQAGKFTTTRKMVFLK